LTAAALSLRTILPIDRYVSRVGGRCSICPKLTIPLEIDRAMGVRRHLLATRRR
jgi:hypothetical protein